MNACIQGMNAKRFQEQEVLLRAQTGLIREQELFLRVQKDIIKTQKETIQNLIRKQKDLISTQKETIEPLSTDRIQGSVLRLENGKSSALVLIVATITWAVAKHYYESVT